MVQVRIWATVGPTEKAEKVMKACGMFFPDLVMELEGGRVEGRGKSRDDLEVLRQKIWARKILDTARNIMLSRIDGNRTELPIHRQAAFAGRLAVLSRETESPLGAVHIEIQSGKLEELIDWLAPETIEGRPVSRTVSSV